MRFWISLTLGLMTYFLFGRSDTHEGIAIVATLVVMAAAYFLLGWATKKTDSEG